jgi:hypothetical protein
LERLCVTHDHDRRVPATACIDKSRHVNFYTCLLFLHLGTKCFQEQTTHAPSPNLKVAPLSKFRVSLFYGAQKPREIKHTHVHPSSITITLSYLHHNNSLGDGWMDRGEAWRSRKNVLALHEYLR